MIRRAGAGAQRRGRFVSSLDNSARVIRVEDGAIQSRVVGQEYEGVVDSLQRGHYNAVRC